MKKELTAAAVFQAGPPTVVVLVTCVDIEGRPNIIITLGEYMPISFNPQLVCIGISPKRYSHDLIAETGEFVINIPTADLREKVHLCGVRSGRETDKFAATGLTPAPAKRVRPPLIEECYGHLECRVVKTLTCGDHTLFVGEVLAASVDPGVLTDGRLDLLKARPMVQKNYVYHAVGERVS